MINFIHFFEQIFHIPEEQIVLFEVDSNEENEFLINERPIDVESSGTVQTLHVYIPMYWYDSAAEMIEMKSDINDTRTPISTPPEKYVQNA